MTAVPPEAITAAVYALEHYQLTVEGDHEIPAVVTRLLEVAAPHIRAQVYAEIRQLAAERGATWLEPCDADDHERGLHTHHRRPFADLIPGGDND